MSTASERVLALQGNTAQNIKIHDNDSGSFVGVTAIPFWQLGDNVSHEAAKQVAEKLKEILGEGAIVRGSDPHFGFATRMFVNIDHIASASPDQDNQVVVALCDLAELGKKTAQNTEDLQDAFTTLSGLPAGSVKFHYDTLNDRREAYIEVKPEAVRTGALISLSRSVGVLPSQEEEKAAKLKAIQNQVINVLKDVKGAQTEVGASAPHMVRVTLNEEATRSVISTSRLVSPKAGLR